MKKIISLVSIMLILTLALPSTAMAYTCVIDVSNGSHTFSKDWSASKSVKYKDVECRLDYGFNTFLINEDTAASYTVGNEHRSRIKNNNGTHYGPWKRANDFSDTQVRHSGSTIRYYMDWNN